MSAGSIGLVLGSDDTIAARIQRVMTERGIQPRELAMALGQRHWSTAYRVMSGATADSLISTIVDICRVLDVDPDELLGVSPPTLEPDTQLLLDAARDLTEDDQWLVVDLVRVLRRKGERAQRQSGAE